MNYQEKRAKLPQAIKDFLASDNPRWESEKACFLYGLPPEKISIITYPIALVFVGDIELKNYPSMISKGLGKESSIIYGIAYEINKRIFHPFSDYFKNSAALLDQWGKLKSAPLINEEEAKKKVLALEPWILEMEKEKRQAEEERKRYAENFIKISVSEALKSYPELGEQLITSERIILKSFPDPARPSIKNWLADYNFVMGYDRERSAIERTNYLFHSPNTQRLNPAEREKLAHILKSFDENSPVTVNKNSRQVVFPQIASKPVPRPVPSPISQAVSRPASNALPARQPYVSHGGGHSYASRPASQPAPRPFQPAPRPPFQAPAKPGHPAPPTQKQSAPIPQGKLEIKEPPTAVKKEDRNVRFTSPQTLPFEKESKSPLQPYRITPFGSSSDEKNPEEDPKSSKNVINLKE